MTTTTRITIEHLGPTANFNDLLRFTLLLEVVCQIDNRVESYVTDLHDYGIDLTIDGTVTAQDLSNEVYEGKRGAW
jgi:hypothetical protein